MGSMRSFALEHACVSTLSLDIVTVLGLWLHLTAELLHIFVTLMLTGMTPWQRCLQAGHLDLDPQVSERLEVPKAPL